MLELCIMSPLGETGERAFIKKMMIVNFGWKFFCKFAHDLIGGVMRGVYTQNSNRKHGRVGHVFQGRYKAILIEKEAYLLKLSRYVVLNPVRAGMVNDIEDWEWSSYSAMIGKELLPEWLETDWLLSRFGSSKKEAIIAYKNYVREGIGLPPIWEGLKYQMYLGEDSFIEKIQEINKSYESGQNLKEVPRLQRRLITKALKWYEKTYESREEAMAQAYFSGNYTMKEISSWFKVHYSTVSRAVRKIENA